EGAGGAARAAARRGRAPAGDAGRERPAHRRDGAARLPQPRIWHRHRGERRKGTRARARAPPGPRPHAARAGRPLDHGADQPPAEAFRGGVRMTLVQRSAVALVLVATFAAHAQTSADALQRAAEGNDYRAFREALDSAKEPKAVYRDIDAVWSYAQSSPTGAFFDDKSELMSIVRKYPGYAKAIADATLTAGGRTLYPTRETRLFLAKQSRAAVPAAVTPASPRPVPAAETTAR